MSNFVSDRADHSVAIEANQQVTSNRTSEDEEALAWDSIDVLLAGAIVLVSVISFGTGAVLWDFS